MLEDIRKKFLFFEDTFKSSYESSNNNPLRMSFAKLLKGPYHKQIFENIVYNAEKKQKEGFGDFYSNYCLEQVDKNNFFGEKKNQNYIDFCAKISVMAGFLRKLGLFVAEKEELGYYDSANKGVFRKLLQNTNELVNLGCRTLEDDYAKKKITKEEMIIFSEKMNEVLSNILQDWEVKYVNVNGVSKKASECIPELKASYDSIKKLKNITNERQQEFNKEARELVIARLGPKNDVKNDDNKEEVSSAVTVAGAVVGVVSIGSVVFGSLELAKITKVISNKTAAISMVGAGGAILVVCIVVVISNELDRSDLENSINNTLEEQHEDAKRL